MDPTQSPTTLIILTALGIVVPTLTVIKGILEARRTAHASAAAVQQVNEKTDVVVEGIQENTQITQATKQESATLVDKSDQNHKLLNSNLDAVRTDLRETRADLTRANAQIDAVMAQNTALADALAAAMESVKTTNAAIIQLQQTVTDRLITLTGQAIASEGKKPL